MSSAEPEGEVVLGHGKFLELRRRGRWEYATRPGITEIVVIVALTADGEAVLVEQHRPPVSAQVIEWPAGLVGDHESPADEDLFSAANRELEEEAGYRASSFSVLAVGAPSAGMSDERITLLRAEELRKVGEGGGVGHEEIKVHLVPLPEIDAWLVDRAQAGFVIDIKVYAGLYFVRGEQAYIKTSRSDSAATPSRPARESATP